MYETKKYHVIKAVYHGKKTKQRASVELNISLRQVNRLLKHYSLVGKAAFSHKNKQKKPKHALSESVKSHIVEVYQSFGNVKPNVVHFTDILAQEYGIVLSDTTVRSILYKEGIASPKSHRKTIKRLKQVRKQKKHPVTTTPSHLPHACDFLEDSQKVHPSRPRKKYCGELIQMDASPFVWFGEHVTHLHVAIDDASGNIVGAYFAPQETLQGYYHVLNQILRNYGIPAAFLTDRRTVFEYKKKGEHTLGEDTMTQFGFACFQLGITIETTSIPQAKGRVERLNNTLQSRLPVDLARQHISTIDEANRFLKKWIKTFNQTFGEKAQESVYEPAPKPSQINLLLAKVSERKVDAGHHIRFNNHAYLPVENLKDVYFTRHTKALVIEAFNGEIFLNVADKIYATRRLLSHELESKTFDVCEENIKKERRHYIPPQSHPWKLASFKRYLKSIGKTLEEYRDHQTA